MKKIIFLIVASLMISSNAFAQETPTPFQAVHPDKAIILQEGEAKMFCPKCTKELAMSYKTNHASNLNGKVKQYCSIHCLAKTMVDGKKVTGIKVVDNINLKFISVINSWYVMGSDKAATKGCH
ncbi:MAG: hypothetical protein Q9M39_05075 [Sulfurovum sp.]|nr:hypothetical protein [Sulfurovum sp.]